MTKEFQPQKKKIDDNPAAILLNFTKQQKLLLASPPQGMTLEEVLDTRVLVGALDSFIEQFNAAVYEVQTLREALKMLDEQKKPTGLIV